MTAAAAQDGASLLQQGLSALATTVSASIWPVLFVEVVGDVPHCHGPIGPMQQVRDPPDERLMVVDHIAVHDGTRSKEAVMRT